MPPLNHNRPKVAVVGDDLPQRSGVVASLRGDFEIEGAEDYEGAYRLLREWRPDILILDFNMASGGLREGLNLLHELGESDLDTLTIVLSDDQRKGTSLRVMNARAYDYLLKRQPGKSCR